MNAGKVWLVGAGPGDPELLTLRAVRAIGAADVILIDDLVDRRVLAHAQPAARVVEVGKRGGCASTPQEFIERLMLHEARAGHCVLRLKGGDPFLFGRGGEELATLRAAGIDVELVPGITSGMAAPMAAGVAVTHRNASPGVIFVTGHEKGESSRVNWAALAATRLTLVVYMGVARAGAIATELIAAGMPTDTPVVAVSSATRAEQKTASGELSGLSELLRREGIESPAILVIGEVARAAELTRSVEFEDLPRAIPA